VLATGKMRLLSLTSRCLSRLHPAERFAGRGPAKGRSSLNAAREELAGEGGLCQRRGGGSRVVITPAPLLAAATRLHPLSAQGLAADIWHGLMHANAMLTSNARVIDDNCPSDG